MKKTAHRTLVAYFSAEFGISNDLPLYAGGLGILAGDTLKAAADMDFPMVGVGMLFEAKYFKQVIKPDGWQTEEKENFDLADSGLEQVMDNGKPLTLVTNLAGTDVWVQAYRKVLSPLVSCYFLTTDCSYNTPEWKEIMVEEYCCNDEMQLKQMLILGIAGFKLLQVLGIKPNIYHINEGRPIFLFWQFVHTLMCTENISFSDAFAKARNQIVYTNHTLLRSGNLLYPTEIIKKYAASFVSELGVSSNELVNPGIDKTNDLFSITQFALAISHKASAVSNLHYELSKNEWPEYSWSGVTNGVHLPTWQSRAISQSTNSSDLWTAHLVEKVNLAKLVEERTGFTYDTNRLVISWARRITGYKQLTSIFRDTSRLSKILKKNGLEIQLLISGKAHYGDEDAKRMIQEIIQMMQHELNGNALYIPNYNIELAQRMTAGSDIWLNTPELGKEACGTSGMKAAVNGVLNVTVADGWAAEIDWHNKGWTLNSDAVSENLYFLLEQNIAPLYYQRVENNFPAHWVSMMEESKNLAEFVNAERMLSEYEEKLYTE